MKLTPPRKIKRKAKVKTSLSVFDTDMLEAFRATGKGWQTRMNEALKKWLREHAA